MSYSETGIRREEIPESLDNDWVASFYFEAVEGMPSFTAVCLLACLKVRGLIWLAIAEMGKRLPSGGAPCVGVGLCCAWAYIGATDNDEPLSQPHQVGRAPHRKTARTE
jgi:hypothetical protein